MPKYVKISKAKNLRFRLISVLYLLFISLSIIQIPIEWLRVNPYYSKYMRAITSKDAVAPQLIKARDIITKVDSAFISFAGFDEIKNTVREPAGYSSTDQFFIKSKNSVIVFNALRELHAYYKELSADHPKRLEFERLFAADLSNGLSEDKESIWSEWKFKHVPATVVRALLAEMKLRLNLLNGAIDLSKKEEESAAVIQLAFNVDLLQLGDTARFVASRKRTEVSVKQNNRVSNEFYWKGDTLYLVPTTTGSYQVDFKTDDGVESIAINVEPTTFIKEKGQAVQFFYVGKPADLKYQNIQNISSVRCDCAQNADISLKPGVVSFLPKTAGWCNFEIFNGTGTRLLWDSIYVQELPKPIILASNVTAGKISVSRLSQQQGLRLTAVHPDMDNFNYNIVSMKATLIGIDAEAKIINGAFIGIHSEQLNKVKFIQVNEVSVKSNVRDFVIKEPLLIEII
jgi:hypothetical protein